MCAHIQVSCSGSVPWFVRGENFHATVRPGFFTKFRPREVYCLDGAKMPSTRRVNLAGLSLFNASGNKLSGMS
jgi:hypothetical protein